MISEYFDALTKENYSLVLNFIYGDLTNNVFTPIDGQQRLTSLFLLHWYIFKRSGYEDGIKILQKFSYLTRDTSKRFCNKICEDGIKIDFYEDHINTQIKDCYWFSGSFNSDPTIQSMLVVLDNIFTN